MNLSIIIPHLKGKTILNECIQSIYDTLDSIEYELIIVNNNCQDNSIEYIAKKFSQCKIIDSNINLGYAGGCNLGAKNAAGKYLLFLNDDTIITKNCISELINTIEKNNNISSVQPKIKNYFEKKSSSCSSCSFWGKSDICIQLWLCQRCYGRGICPPFHIHFI